MQPWAVGFISLSNCLLLEEGRLLAAHWDMNKVFWESVTDVPALLLVLCT